MKLLTLLLFFAGFAYGQSPCYPEFDHNYDFINHFEFNSLFNVESEENGDYTVYSMDDFTTTLSIGGTYSIQLATENAPNFNNRFTVWIDFDNDSIFTNDEVILDEPTQGNYENEWINIPADSSYIGVKRMRIMMASSPDTLDPCGQYYTGESEDYFITITDEYIEPCYCTPFLVSSSGTSIEDFHIGNIFNCDSGYDPISYYNFYPDSVFTTDLELGETYRILVSKGTNAGTSVGVRVDVDFNDNYLFDPDESIFVTPNSVSGIVNRYITIPNDSSFIGHHRMRVRMSRWDTPSSACIWSRGETEDYIINIVPPDTSQVLSPDWQKVIDLPNDQIVSDISETYDSGYMISLREVSDTSKFRLIKFSVDGDTLWSKYPPTSDGYNFPTKIQESHDGGFVICGVNDNNDPNGEAYVMKLNACGDIEWNKSYGNTNNYDWASHIVESTDSNYVVLLLYLNDTSRIALAKLDTLGNVIWQYDYTHHVNSQPRELIETSDKGFLITGYTYTQNPGDTTLYWLRSMLIKIDSIGNEEWEKVLGLTATSLSHAFSSVELQSGGFLVSTAIVDLGTTTRSLGVYRVDEMGNLLFYKTVSEVDDIANYGQFFRKMDDDKYCIVSNIVNTCFEFTTSLGLYLIDSDANALDSAFVNDYYLDIKGAVVTADNKLVVSGNKEFPDQDDIFLYKFNAELEFDTLYNTDLEYDWIHCDEIIISTAELPDENIDVTLYPNPTCDGINIQIDALNDLNYKVEIMSMDGAILRNEYLRSKELKYFSLDGFNQGMYIITISNNAKILSSKKIIKSR